LDVVKLGDGGVLEAFGGGEDVLGDKILVVELYQLFLLGFDRIQRYDEGFASQQSPSSQACASRLRASTSTVGAMRRRRSAARRSPYKASCALSARIARAAAPRS
jgi:hypothetical protein